MDSISLLLLLLLRSLKKLEQIYEKDLRGENILRIVELELAEKRTNFWWFTASFFTILTISKTFYILHYFFGGLTARLHLDHRLQCAIIFTFWRRQSKGFKIFLYWAWHLMVVVLNPFFIACWLEHVPLKPC